MQRKQQCPVAVKRGGRVCESWKFFSGGDGPLVGPERELSPLQKPQAATWTPHLRSRFILIFKFLLQSDAHYKLLALLTGGERKLDHKINAMSSRT